MGSHVSRCELSLMMPACGSRSHSSPRYMLARMFSIWFGFGGGTRKPACGCGQGTQLTLAYLRETSRRQTVSLTVKDQGASVCMHVPPCRNTMPLLRAAASSVKSSRPPCCCSTASISDFPCSQNLVARVAGVLPCCKRAEFISCRVKFINDSFLCAWQLR